MYIDLSVILEGCGDRPAGGERPAEAVDKHVYLLALEFGEVFSTVERSKS